MGLKQIMMEATFKQMYFSFGSVEKIKLEDFCHRNNYKIDDLISLFCTAFNGDLDFKFVRNKYPQVEDRCKIFRELGFDWRNK